MSAIKRGDHKMDKQLGEREREERKRKEKKAGRRAEKKGNSALF